MATSALLALSLTVVGGQAAMAESTAPVDISGFDDGRYVVVLDGEPLATYRGSIPGLRGTSPTQGNGISTTSNAAVSYTDHIEQVQSEVAADAGVTIETSYSLTINGFATDLTATQAADLSRDSRVTAIVPDELQHIDASPANEFIDLDGLFAQAGGAASAGDGIVVGVIDTGIAPENPFFAGEALGTTAGAEPYLDGDTIVYEKSDGSTFTGVCQTGSQFTADMCSTKIVGARYFIDGFGVGKIGTEEQVPGEYVSPRDGDGHGSHTASTAAGNADTAIHSPGGSDLGTMSGVAPAARISAYKACWSGPDPTITDDDGCATSDLLSAIDAAVADGVDVINYSIGGGAAASVASLTDQAFLGAAAAGVFVSASAGNSGPDDSTLDHASPWYTTVAASSIVNYEGTAALADGTLVPGATVTIAEPLTGTLVYAGDIPAAGAAAADAALCLPGTLDAALAAGMIVLCDRGNNARAEKSQVAADAGAIAVVLANVTAGSVDLDDHAVPTLHVDVQYRDAVLASVGSEITLTAGNTTGIVTPAPVVADFSSRGPVLVDGSDVIKPDVAAPGVGIIAGAANAAGAEANFEFLSGTSMAAPHVTGLAAVYLGEHPQALPSEVKSALMTTATDTLTVDGATETNPFVQGAGNVEATSMLDAGLVYLNGPSDWYGYLRGVGYQLPDTWVGAEIDPSDLNIASIGIGALTGTQTVTRTVTSLAPGSYAATVEAPAGVDVTVTPSTLDFTEAGQTADFTVTFTSTASALEDQWATGTLTWADGTHTVRSPLAVVPTALAVPEIVEGTGTAGSASVTLTSGIEASVDISTAGLVRADEIIAGEGVPGDSLQGQFTVADGETHRIVTLEGDSSIADLDLSVYRVVDGTPVAEWISGTETAHEQVIIEAPVAGEYYVFADFYSATDGASTPVSVTTAGVGGSAAEVGELTVDPSSLSLGISERASTTLDWRGLDTHAEYWGTLAYSTVDTQTLVHVTTGDLTLPAASRLEGADRYETAVAASQAGYPDGADVVYLASGEAFPDALSAGPAAAHEGGPLLLTPSAATLDTVTDEIERLGASTVVIVGGTNAVSQAVEDAVSGIASVDRIAGADRYETSRLVVAHAFDEAQQAIVAAGADFPDALTAGAAAGANEFPLLLVNGAATTTDTATIETLSDLGVEVVSVAGGREAVTGGVEQSLLNSGFFTQRIAGADRYLTGVLINRTFFSTGVDTMYVATGESFPDALAGSALAGAQGSPLYITPSSCALSDLFSESQRLGQPDVVVLGGPAAVSDAMVGYQQCG